MISPDTLGLCGKAFEGRARCDCILRADGDTDRSKSFPSFVLLYGKLRNRPCKMKNHYI